MRIKRFIPMTRLLLLPCLTIVIIGLSAYFSDEASSQGPPLKVSNRTHACEIVKVETNSERVRLSLKNNYNKTITAYAISVGDDSHSHREPSSHLTAGSTWNHDLRLRAGRIEGEITVLAVVFEDGSSDGDARVAKEITDYRLARKTQRERIIPVLRKVLAARDTEIQSALEKAHAALYALPTGYRWESHFTVAGLRNARASILMDFEELKKLGPTEDLEILRWRINVILRSLQRD